MNNGPLIRCKSMTAAIGAIALAACAALAQAPAPDSVVLDRVVAVVNNQTILASDVDEEMRFASLEPSQAGSSSLSPARALDLLISRALIQQQIRQEEAQATVPTQTEIDARLTEMRKELPACVRENCASDAGWNTFLTTRHLTAEEVQAYLRNRLEILSFIEQRFRQGIRISPAEIETYYRETLLPLYGPEDKVPPLEKVSSRIEEVLLQQQVNALLDDWLKNLRSQGDIEVLDPSLETPEAKSGGGGLGE